MSTTALPVPRRVADAAAAPAEPRALRQLRLPQILAVWAAAAIPMGVLAWLVAPLLADQMSGDTALPRALILCLTAGLVWQFTLVMTLVRREQGTLRLAVVRDALWLRAPQSPKTGRRGGRVWLVVPALALALGIKELVPGLPVPSGRDLATFFESNAAETLFAGSWGWFAAIAALAVFNTVLGEELLFRGYLLPRMSGVFGKRDWLANGVLFACVYHVHVPWVIPVTLLDTFIVVYPSRRYRSALVGIAVHSVQSLLVIGLALSLVMG